MTGEGPPLPLSDLRILAVEQYGAGPFGTQFLADLGADVIKIEDRKAGGDVSRSVGPYFAEGVTETAASLFYQSLNRNKRSLTLDLSGPDGQAVFHDLVRSADAVTGNLRGDVPARLGLTYETLGRVKPTIVCGHLSAYGRDGPRAAWPGYDYLMQAEAGYFSLTGDPDGPPSRMGLSLVDYMAGITMAFALLAGIHDARRTGKGRDFDVSLFDTALFNLNYLASWYLGTGHSQRREARSAHPSLTPCQLYRTADGWIYLMCNKEKFWRVLCERIGRADLGADARFATFAARLGNRAVLTEILDAALSRATTAAWLDRFAGAVPAAPLRDVAGALDQSFVQERGGIVETRQPGGGPPVRAVANPIRAGGATWPARAAPALGDATEDILTELGYDRARRTDLARRGVV